MNPTNLLANLPQHGADEQFTSLIDSPHVRIERIVSQGHASPDGFWYDQPQQEWVLILQGGATIRFEDRTIEMEPGDSLNIPAHQKHRVEWTKPEQPTVWLTVHYE